MSWKYPILMLSLFVLLAGCTQLIKTGGGQTGASGGISSVLPQISGFKTIQELSDIGLSISGQNGPVSVRAVYPEMVIGGKKCRVTLSYTSSSCRDGLKVEGNKATWCDGTFSYELNGGCAIDEKANELKASPVGARISQSLFLPWKEDATDVEVKMEVLRQNAKITYVQVTGDYASEFLDKKFEVLEKLTKRAFCLDDCKKVYFFIEDPSKIILVESLTGETSKEIAREIMNQNLGKVFDCKPTTILEYLPPDSYSISSAPYICYNPYGIVRIEPGLFSFKENRLNAKSDPDHVLVSPASFVVNPLSINLGGKQLSNLGLQLNKLSAYQNRYKACQIGCYESCKFDDVMVMKKMDCTTTSRLSKPAVLSKMGAIYDLIARMRGFEGINDVVCFGIIGTTDGQRSFLGDYAADIGWLVYGRVIYADKTLDLVFVPSGKDATVLLPTLIEKKVNKKYELSLEKESGNCKLYSWGKSTDWRGYAGVCNQGDVQLLFMNHCTQNENCQPSAEALFNYITM